MGRPAPVTYGERRVMAVIGAYSALYPQVGIDLMLNNRVVDMADEGIDIAMNRFNPAAA